MFNFVYLNKSKNLIDIRLSEQINSKNFHQKMENLGLINIVMVICWELNINLIKISDIVGQITFSQSYSNYYINQYFDDLPGNYIELDQGQIVLNHLNKKISFDFGFLNWKNREYENVKAKIRPDVIQSGSSTPSNERRNQILSKLANGKKSFMVLASDSEQIPNTYKIFIPDTFGKKELKYVTMIEKQKPKHILKPKLFKTRSYSLLFYTWIDN